MSRKILFRSIQKCYRSAPILFIINTILTIFVGVGTAANVFVLQNLINNIQLYSQNGNNVYQSMFFFLIVNFVFILFGQFQNYVNQLLTLKIEYNLEMSFVTKCSELDLEDFEDEQTYNLISKVQNLGQSKLINVYFHFMELIQSLISIIAIISLILSFDNIYWIIILLVPIVSFFVNRKLGRYSYEVEKNNTIISRKADYIKYLITNNIAIKEIISFDYFGRLSSRFKQTKDEILDYMKRLTIVHISVNSIILILELIIKTGLIIVFILSSLKRNGLIGDIMGFIYSIETIQSNFMSVFNSLSQIYKDRLYVENYFEFIDLDKTDVEGIIIKEKINSIRLKNINFSYNENQVLHDINLELEPNKPIVLVGENGSGKSTLIKILSGLYNNYEGNIYINGLELNSLNKKEYRKHVSVIFQDFNQYEFNLRENITIANMDEVDNDALIYDILKEVNLMDEIARYKDGLESQMGKWFGGEELSKGQWQRIALSRVLLRNSDVIIMDEPTSALDPKMEKYMIDCIKEFSKDKILILVTHRLPNIVKYDPYFVFIKDGRIMEGDYKDELEEFLQFG
jgi:ABC-type multidrug transport system fused ATPase/permease subunit